MPEPDRVASMFDYPSGFHWEENLTNETDSVKGLLEGTERINYIKVREKLTCVFQFKRVSDKLLGKVIKSFHLQ